MRQGLFRYERIGSCRHLAWLITSFLLSVHCLGYPRQLNKTAYVNQASNVAGNDFYEVVIEGAVAAEADAFTGMAQNLVRFGVPAVVAMQYPIRDIAAVLFTKSFYAKLIANYSIDAAIAETRRDLKNKFGLGQQDWATPVLFMRAHQGRIFTSPD